MDNSMPKLSPKIKKLLNEHPKKLRITGAILLCIVPLAVIAVLSISEDVGDNGDSLLASLLRLLSD